MFLFAIVYLCLVVEKGEEMKESRKSCFLIFLGFEVGEICYGLSRND